jgi:hypothetical protein
MGIIRFELRISGPRLLSLVRANSICGRSQAASSSGFGGWEELSSGRMLQDQMRADSQYEQLLSWILNGEERGVRQAQTPVKKDLGNRRDLWLNMRTCESRLPVWRARDRPKGKDKGKVKDRLS